MQPSTISRKYSGHIFSPASSLFDFISSSLSLSPLSLSYALSLSLYLSPSLSYTHYFFACGHRAHKQTPRICSAFNELGFDHSVLLLRPNDRSSNDRSTNGRKVRQETPSTSWEAGKDSWSGFLLTLSVDQHSNVVFEQPSSFSTLAKQCASFLNKFHLPVSQFGAI